MLQKSYVVYFCTIIDLTTGPNLSFVGPNIVKARKVPVLIYFKMLVKLKEKSWQLICLCIPTKTSSNTENCIKALYYNMHVLTL